MTNKNFQHNNQIRDGFSKHSKSSILPSPAILESYEELAPGIVKKLAAMAELEQKHRHEDDKRRLKALSYTTRFGQCLGFLLCLAIIFYTVSLVLSGHHFMAVVLCISGFSFMAYLAVLASPRSKSKQDFQARHKKYKHYKK